MYQRNLYHRESRSFSNNSGKVQNSSFLPKMTLTRLGYRLIETLRYKKKKYPSLKDSEKKCEISYVTEIKKLNDLPLKPDKIYRSRTSMSC